jgi:hypothetical protein
LQVKAAQPRHLHIGDKARCVVNLLGFKKIISRGKRGSVVAQRSHERFRRIAHGFFVIDNRNQYLRHGAFAGACHSAGARARLSATDAISYVSDKGMLRCAMWDTNHASYHFLCRVRYRMHAGLPPTGLAWPILLSHFCVVTIPYVPLVYSETYGNVEIVSLRTSL